MNTQGPLMRLLRGHTAAPRFKIGYTESIFLFNNLDQKRPGSAGQASSKTRAPLPFLTGGYSGKAGSSAWLWRHLKAHIFIDGRCREHQRQRRHGGARVYLAPQEGIQWTQFLESNTHAAAARPLRGRAWRSVEQRFKTVSKLQKKRRGQTPAITGQFARAIMCPRQDIKAPRVCRSTLVLSVATPSLIRPMSGSALACARDLVSNQQWPRGSDSNSRAFLDEIAAVRATILRARYGQ